MKKILLIIAITFTNVIQCQIKSNIITETEFDNITINNVKFLDLKNTLGKQSSIERIFGIPISKSIDPDGEFTYYEFDGFNIGFSSIISNGTISNPIIGGFEIKNNNYSITIKGSRVTIGDNISNLGTVAFNTQRDGSKSIVYQYCDGCNNYIYIYFNQLTKVITEIGFIEQT